MNRTIFPFVLAIVLASAHAHAEMKPEIAAGFKAGFSCSGIFHAHRGLEQVLAEELGGIPEVEALPLPVVDTSNKTVTVVYDAALPPRVARFIDGLGTVLLPVGAAPTDQPHFPAVDIPMPEGDTDALPWPDGDLIPEAPLPEGVDHAALQTTVERAFDTRAWPNTKTIGVVVVHKDRIIAEQYAPGWNKHTQYRTWSTGKSIANALVGILVKQGRLSTTQPAPIAEWQAPEDERKKITIENLLEMSSGLKSPGAMTYSGYWGGIDSAADAAAGELKYPPGSRWMYANYDTLLLMKSMRNVLNDDAAYLSFPRRELLNKIGMRHTFPEVDAYGNFVMSSQVYTTPRDLARFGLLYLHDGVWNGERILPEGWVAYSTTPAPAYKKSGTDDQRGYGKQWWLYNNALGLPADTFTTAGNRGQFCTILPGKQLIIVRMGIDPMWQSDWNQPKFAAEVAAAVGD